MSKKERVLAKYDDKSVRLIDELEEMLKILVWQRETLGNQVKAGFGYKQDTIDLKAVTASKELSMAYTRMVEAQIKLDKHLKAVADMMSPEEEKEAVEKYFQTLETGEAGKLLSKIVDKHNDRVDSTGIKKTIQESKDDNDSTDEAE
jgi:hypothetical protein